MTTGTKGRSRRRLYEIPNEREETLEPEVLPPLRREAPPSASESQSSDSVQTQRMLRAMSLVRRYTVLSTASGFLPLGVGNAVVSGGVQVQMVRKLCKCYKTDFSKHGAVAAISIVFGVFTSAGIISLVGSAAATLVPGLAGILSTAASVLTSHSTTFLIGRVFVFHFEMGGSLFDLDAEQTREIISRLQEQGEMARAT